MEDLWEILWESLVGSLGGPQEELLEDLWGTLGGPLGDLWQEAVQPGKLRGYIKYADMDTTRNPAV